MAAAGDKLRAVATQLEMKPELETGTETEPEIDSDLSEFDDRELEVVRMEEAGFVNEDAGLVDEDACVESPLKPRELNRGAFSDPSEPDGNGQRKCKTCPATTSHPDPVQPDHLIAWGYYKIVSPLERVATPTGNGS